MRFRIRWPAFVTLAAVATVLLSLSPIAAVSADDDDDAEHGRGHEHRVTIKDNNAPSPKDGFDPRQGRWQFSPRAIEVKRGESVVFRNPRGNDHPHTATDLRRTSPATTVPAIFVGGDLFDSGNIDPGESFTLDTGKLAQGHYPYVCRLHPWMNGEVTVVD